MHYFIAKREAFLGVRSQHRGYYKQQLLTAQMNQPVHPPPMIALSDPSHGGFRDPGGISDRAKDFAVLVGICNAG